MSERWTELRRDEWTDGAPTACLRCGRPVRLMFYGGELDTKRCCGLKYDLEHVRIDRVVYAPAALPQADGDPGDENDYQTERAGV